MPIKISFTKKNDADYIIPPEKRDEYIKAREAADSYKKVELSRRVGKLMNMKSISSLPWDEHLKFVYTIDGAESFEDLPIEYQKIILDAEKEFAQELAGLKTY